MAVHRNREGAIAVKNQGGIEGFGFTVGGVGDDGGGTRAAGNFKRGFIDF
jgi:hypothetical protein